VSEPGISAFAGTANGNAAPTRQIKGQATLQARTNHEMAVDSVHDEIVAPNPFAQAILFFRGGASGNEAPIRIIQGPKTLLDYTDDVTVDMVHNEVITAQERTNAILVFRREPGGNVAPIRILHGPKTKLDSPQRVSVDPVNNLLAVTSPERVLVFDRTANGDVAPKWDIEGSNADVHTSMIRTPILYPDGKELIVAGNPRVHGNGVAVAVWKYGDTGNVAPWAVIRSSPTTRLIRSNGSIAVNFEAKELMVMGGQVSSGAERILVFDVPELFR
jgi:hypothetical protein